MGSYYLRGSSTGLGVQRWSVLTKRQISVAKLKASFPALNSTGAADFFHSTEKQEHFKSIFRRWVDILPACLHCAPVTTPTVTSPTLLISPSESEKVSAFYQTYIVLKVTWVLSAMDVPQPRSNSNSLSCTVLHIQFSLPKPTSFSVSARERELAYLSQLL